MTSAQKELLDELLKPGTKLCVEVTAGDREPVAAEYVRTVRVKHKWSYYDRDEEQRSKARITSVRSLEKEGLIKRPKRTDLERRYVNEAGQNVVEEIWTVDKKAVAAAEVKDPKEAVTRNVIKKLEGWHVVKKYPSSSSNSVHTVEYDGTNYRCTCQGFRIKQRGYCTHTEQASAEGLV